MCMTCKGYRFFTLLGHTLTSAHTRTLQFIYLFFSQALPVTDGQFHGHVCELLDWVNQIVLWGEKERGRDAGTK